MAYDRFCNLHNLQSLSSVMQIELYKFYIEIKLLKKGKTVIKLAKDAPAPSATNIAGKAQHIKVEEDANNEKKFVALSFTELLIFR